ncbi:MAG TPA: CRISPR-associated helicase Cas3' [Edaphocola sp.]|nr:CRISPR-associated helicase Cas3' [Edaphocola sp.]
MVFGLAEYKSHPDKLLKVHTNGVQSKTMKRTKSKIAEVASLFHDLGKLNFNFQGKLNGDKSVGYSQHSYVSAFAFLNWYVANKDEATKTLGIDGNDITKIKIITAIILHHHGNLPNMDRNISAQTFAEMSIFLDGNFEQLPVSEFLEKEMEFGHIPFDLSVKPWYKLNIPDIDLGRNSKEYEIGNWQKDSFNYFLETQFSFASLIESDKRDAGDNERFNNLDLISNNAYALNESLNSLFNDLEATPKISDLNKLRTIIRNEAVSTVSDLLATGQRVFTLTAPTGAGKTFTLLDIARTIQKNKGDIGIIFALPFLSITDQVQHIINDVLKIDSLSVNSKSINERIEKAQQNLEQEQSPEALKALLVEDFIENTFDHPLIITTFVQLFETFLSNRNSTLLKLPNFANRIFLIDELQALPPRLYIFFGAWLDEFCRKYNSYAILSTATMPDLRIPVKPELKENVNYKLQDANLFFKNYITPNELLEPTKYFENNVFNRYVVNVIDEDLSIESLAERILQEDSSVLVILNTIQDTKDLYEELSELSDAYLLNTHFTPEDRLDKIEEVKKLLSNKKIILISTQLIEAGVDIDFPVVYRDLCPLPSLIQSAGRCNRNKKIDLGNVNLIRLRNRKGKYSSELIYRNAAKLFLDFIKENIVGQIQEKELFQIQKQFFGKIAENLEIGNYPEETMNLIKEINNAQFENVGKFQLINNKIFGNQYQFFIPVSEDDNRFEELEEVLDTIKESDYSLVKQHKIKIETKIKVMSNRVISVRLYNDSDLPPLANPKMICGMYKLDLKNYSKERGVVLSLEDVFL